MRNRNSHVALIGIGPHAKRIYLNYFKKHNYNLPLVVELESNKDNVTDYLKNNGFQNTKIFTIPDKYKDNIHLPKKYALNLLKLLQDLHITHIIVSTEPKAHYMYIEFALKNNINVLTDKPITVMKNMTDINNINEVRKQYYKLVKLEKKSKAYCKIMCQRQYHKGYEYINKLLNDTVKKYKIPITYIDIYHCDGNWEMPHDLDKENHPYKYGYGKLFHSGYHFIDLLSNYIKINEQLTGAKKITKGSVFSNFFTPNDELAVFNLQDYQNIFNKQNIPPFYYENKKINFDKYGEKNYYGMFEFKNKYNKTLTSANLNLLHYGFSRRGWIESRDFYKSNGRIRHERVNIQVGPLLNIQVHSYQSKEIKDRTNIENEELTGGLEHFDIDIYRNVDIIGGKPFERIKLGDLYSQKEKEDFLGYNELSRDILIGKFLNGKCDKCDLKSQQLAIEMLYSCACGLSNYYSSIKKEEKIKVQNNNYEFNIDTLREYANTIKINSDKELLSIFEIDKENINYKVISNYIAGDKSYETYIFIGRDNKSVGGLLLKNFHSKVWNNFYFNLLIYMVKLLNIETIESVIKHLSYKKSTKLR